MPVNHIVDQLRREETSLVERLGEVQQQEKEAAGQLKQVQSALSALGEKPSGKPTSKTGKRAVTKTEVIAAMQSVLKNSPPLHIDALKNGVEMRIREQGRSLAGFALRFKESLSDESIIEHEGIYQLANQNLANGH